VFSNEKRELSAGWRAAQKTSRMAGRRAVQKGGAAGCEKGPE